MKTTTSHLSGALLLLAGAAGPAAAQLPINVEIDYMENADHSHRPSQLEIDALVQMFACHGYTLNVVVDDAVPHVDVMQCSDPGAENFWTCVGAESFAVYKLAFQDFGPTGWHYCIFGHDYDNGDGTGSSGLAEVAGNDLIVTLGSFRLGTPNAQVGTPFDRASTLAHELGHNLGLRHWSPDSVLVSGPYAPNYASVMSYQYQLRGVRTQLTCLGLTDSPHLFKDLDYSSGRLAPLSEPALDEALGAGIHAVDWNCDGSVTPGTVSEQLDLDAPWCGQPGSPLTDLRDYDDWSNVIDYAWTPDVSFERRALDTISCITAEELERLESGADGLQNPSSCPNAQPTLSVESCRAGEMVFADASFLGFSNGTGSAPYASLSHAVTQSPDESILYLQPGTYANAGQTILIDKKIVLAGPGLAVVDP